MPASLPDSPAPQTRIARGCLCLSIIISGLALRRYGFGVGLPAFIVKYGGSALWGTMLFLLLGTTAPLLGRRSLALTALAVAVAVELVRLVHTPWLDAFRITLAGALLLGRFFSLADIVAYGGGILLGAVLDSLVLARLSMKVP